MGSLAVAYLTPLAAHAASHAASGGEFQVLGTIAGDQAYPQASLKASGGYIVWQDNATDGDGLGVSARKLDSTLSPSLGNFRVNQVGTGDQENPQVSLLNNGGAAFVWQGGPFGAQRIYTRVLSSGGTWLTGDIQANTFTNDYQLAPVVTTLSGGNYVVAWSSYNQAASDSMQDVYFQIFTAAGVKSGSETLANQTTAYHQRSSAIAALTDGRFVITWVSELQTADNSVDIFARVFNADGTAAGDEFKVNTSTNISCAGPSIASLAGGGFAVTWSEFDPASFQNNSWDIYARVFNASAVGGTAIRVNTTTYGDQYVPKISADGSACLVVWNSLGQDGSDAGVFGQYLTLNGALDGSEFMVNSTTINLQIQPTVTSDGGARFLTLWTGYVPGGKGFELFAQRYASSQAALAAPAAPVVSALDSYRLQVAWPALAGYDVAGYEVYADGTNAPSATVTNTYWWMSGLVPASSHSFRLAYVLADGRRSPLSAATSGSTWGYDYNFDGLPDDWEATYWGANQNNWPSPTVDSDGDGVTNLREFLAGTNPTNSASVLRVQLQSTTQGLYLSWNTQPGLMYQLQSSANVSGWSNLGPARFAAGTNDSVYVGGNGHTFYQVLRLR